MPFLPLRADSRYRLKQLILYIAGRMQDATYYGSTKLNKVLYRAEMESYRGLGSLLTGYHYQKNQRGPTLRAFLPVTRELVSEGAAEWLPTPAGTRTEARFRPTRPADMAVFTEQEIQIIDREIDRAWNLTARQMSTEEHRTAAWFATRTGDDIKPELALVEDPGVIIPLNHEERQRADAAVERFRSRAADLADDHPRTGVRSGKDGDFRRYAAG